MCGWKSRYISKFALSYFIYSDFMWKVHKDNICSRKTFPKCYALLFFSMLTKVCFVLIHHSFTNYLSAEQQEPSCSHKFIKHFIQFFHTCDLKNTWPLSTNFDSFQLLKTEKTLLRDMQFFNGGREAKWNSLSGPHLRAVVSWSHPSFLNEWVVWE